ncbi:queuine tRNA-ribosyltransferase accessory subunit 2 [Bactrocera neohumeralis]|uniref:queuine tRNA-ribosyltransferase accessory subunit 2 n=1 Tax=Bactrocera neohumeralis TaxID=98809 RepID=UPI0021664777|nr:queuine tRNA-ribosyltransferase accessory subunit 2 [Bactrocera neohumeralis]
MKFVVENISKSSGRLGHLVQAETGKRFRTPLLVQTTKAGSIPYLSREVFDYITKETPALQFSLSTINHMTESLKLFNGTLGAYVGYPECLSLLLIRDTCTTTPSGHNDKDIMPLFTRRGKEMLTATSYMDAVEVLKPDIYQGLCDADTNLDSSKKRITKSVDRTAQFMDLCYERHQNSTVLNKTALFVPIVGGYSTFARSDSIKHAKAKGESITCGYIFEGFHNNGLTATEVDVDQIVKVMAHSLNELNVEKPKMMPGAFTPPAMLELISLGVDIFDTSYAFCAASNFKVLTFNFDFTKTESGNCSPFLDLTADSLKEDFTPLLTDCDCLTCKKHTRAYLYHLYNTKEMAGPILIMIHNLHHMMKFFNTICNCIADDKLPDLVKLVKYQGHDAAHDYSIKLNTKAISRNDQGKSFTVAKDDQ